MSVKTLNERGASSWDLVLKILSITLVSLFAFSSGIWFGKKLSDSDYQRQALEGEFDREVRKSSETVAEHDDALTDEEVAAATDKALDAQRKVATDSHGPAEKADQVASAPASSHSAASKTADAHATTDAHASAPTHAAPAAAQAVAPKATVRAVASTATSTTTATSAPSAGHGTETATKPDLSAVHQAAARVANNSAPTTAASEKTTKESRVPSSLPKTVGTTSDVEFTVQVASYPTAEAAREHVDSMVKKGFPAFPVEAKINGKTWYRVSVGSFKSFNDASKFRAQLLKQADLPSAIVQKIAR